MKLQRLTVGRAASCGGLLDGLEVSFVSQSESADYTLSPHCLLGPNGSGKSQFLQLIAEIFQSAWNLYAPDEERDAADKNTLFELEYLISPDSKTPPARIKLRREQKGRRAQQIEMLRLVGGDWKLIFPQSSEFGTHLPSLIVGYTSGDNETLSLPFFVSRSGYSADVREAALPQATRGRKSSAGGKVADNRLLLIDYSTHLEVLVANLLLGDDQVRKAIIDHARLDRLASFRCIVQLNHLNRLKTRGAAGAKRKGIQLTVELEEYIESLKRTATCWNYDRAKEVYTFDMFVNEEMRRAISQFFETPIDLYRAFHKLALLNDLAIPKAARDRLEREIETRRFASRLPEPQDEDKVFRFEQVRFARDLDGQLNELLDYVSLSDGEHQQAQIFGVFSMITEDNALFVLDEPESHFNPQWRVEFVKRLKELPIKNRGAQEVLLTSHAPFVPSDLSREKVHIFSKDETGKVLVRLPEIETFGATFDRVLEHCFEVRPPISQLARDEIDKLMKEGTVDDLKEAMTKLGSSVEKAFLADRMRQLEKAGK